MTSHMRELAEHRIVVDGLFYCVPKMKEAAAALLEAAGEIERLTGEREDVGNDEALAETLAKHRIHPEWHRRGRSIAWRILFNRWQSEEDQRATLVADVAFAMREAAEAAEQRAEKAEADIREHKRAEKAEADAQRAFDRLVEASEMYEQKAFHGDNLDRWMVSVQCMTLPLRKPAGYDPTSNFDRCDGGLPCLQTTTGCAKGQCSRKRYKDNGDGTYTFAARQGDEG